jgi:hypothetical protein
MASFGLSRGGITTPTPWFGHLSLERVLVGRKVMSLLFSALRGTARPASVIGALFLICGTALAIRCKGYARWDGSSYTLECMNACAWGCTKDVGDHVPGIPADTGQEACKCSTTSEPSPCCHIVIVYPRTHRTIRLPSAIAAMTVSTKASVRRHRLVGVTKKHCACSENDVRPHS